MVEMVKGSFDHNKQNKIGGSILQYISQTVNQTENISCLKKKEISLKIFFFALSVSGLQTSQDARFYASSARFEPFSNEGKPLVIQFTVKHEQKIDCGGGYVKVFPADLDQAEMHGESLYYIMFGK